MAQGIKDKVAILGMGCTKFGERWDKDADNLMVEAYEEAIADAGIESSQIDAAWLGVGFDAVDATEDAHDVAIDGRERIVGLGDSGSGSFLFSRFLSR